MTTETEEAAARAAHYSHHVTRCDRVKDLLTDAAQSLLNADHLLAEAADDSWEGDGELRDVDHADAIDLFEEIRSHIRGIQRIVTIFRTDAEHQRQLNAEHHRQAHAPSAKCSNCGFSGAVAERFDVEANRVVWLCWTCRHNATS